MLSQKTRTKTCGFVLLHAWLTGNVEGRPCPPPDNSTRAIVRCILARHEDGDTDHVGEHYVPTEQADEEAQRHLEEMQDSATGFGALYQHLPAATPHFEEQMMQWASVGGAQPRVFALKKGSWGHSCDYAEHNLGYRYMMEHWLRGFLLSNAALLVDDVRAADFVYLAHCATGIFFHVNAADVQEGPRKSSSPLTRGLGIRTLPNGTKIGYSKNLVYEGNLPDRAVRRTDDVYLMRLVEYEWQGNAEFQQCAQRPNCRFLIPSIYGRHVWRRFAAEFGDRAIFITHSGMSDFLSRQPPDYFLASEQPLDIAAESEGRCSASCAAHCVRDPPSVLSGDIVLPWIVWYEWTPRAASSHSRDILAFYSGTENSCSRKKLMDTFRADFDVDVHQWAMRQAESRLEPRAAGARRLPRRTLVFPPEVRLRQEDWSEFAFRSHICIVPDGDSPNTGRLVEVIMHGCVPMIVSNRLQPPLHEYIDWRHFAFFVREESIGDLPQILRDLSTPRGMQQIRARHRILNHAAHMLSTVGDGIGSILFIALRDRARALRLQG